MKRIFTAAILALGIHGLLFGMECSWIRRISFERPQSPVMTLTLAIRQPKLPTSKPVVKKPESVSKKPVVVKKVEKEPKHKPLPKPKPQKTMKADVQPLKKELTKIFQTNPLNESKTLIEPETIFKSSTKEDVEVPSPQFVREASPLYLVNPAPKYPEIARRRGFQGNVVLEVLVGRNGNVMDLRVLSSSGYSVLDKAAATAVKSWVFDPGSRGAKKVDMWVKVPIRFELK